MTTTWPLTKDTFSTKVDNTDDVMASHINNPQDSIIAIEDLRDYSLMRVKNDSGSTVAANDIGYLDASNNFQLTTTYALDANWVVVVAGAADGSDIIVTNKGRVTVIVNGNVSVGDFLFTSTTTKQAQPFSYPGPAMFAQALTANGSGAGETVEALLLCNTRYVPKTSATEILRISNSDDSDWRTTINGAPAGAVVTYTVGLTSGAENTIVPGHPPAGAHYAKTRLYNETRDNHALILSVDIGANTITVTDAADISDWVNTDVITARSQLSVIGAGATYMYDADLSDADNDTIPATARVLEISCAAKDTGAAGAVSYLSTWEVYSGAKVKQTPSYVAGELTFRTSPIPLFQRRFTFATFASGAGTATMIFQLAGWWEAVP